jgi:hypothetical protein
MERKTEKRREGKGRSRERADLGTHATANRKRGVAQCKPLTSGIIIIHLFINQSIN